MKLNDMKKNWTLHVILSLLIIAVFALSVRGLPGVPSSETINLHQWKEGGPFELSPERGRFALLYSVVEDHSLQFSLPIARFTTPDLAINPNGEYVSLFAPAVSFIVIPGYILGKMMGVSQVGAYATIALFASINLLLIRSIVVRLGGDSIAGWLAGIVFAFATPAFAYAVNLYQHHISTFIILASIYSLLKWQGWFSLVLVWFFCALSIVVDNPNLFFMFPIGVYAIGRIISIQPVIKGLKIYFRPLYMLTFLVMIIPISFFLWFNAASHGDALKLSGSLRDVSAIDADGNPTQSDMMKALGMNNRGATTEKSAVGFFQTRNLLNGLFIHIFSPDRGVLNFTPVILLGVFGLFVLCRRDPGMAALLSAVSLVILLLYSLWGDPWGGWAFGSRYLIPAYAILAIGLGMALSFWKKNFIMLFIVFALFVYSAGVNALGAITSSANPPEVQVLGLEQLSGREQKYYYNRNWQYLHEAGSKSFVYQAWAQNKISAVEYYYIVSGMIILMGGGLFMLLIADGRRESKNGNLIQKA